MNKTSVEYLTEIAFIIWWYRIKNKMDTLAEKYDCQLDYDVFTDFCIYILWCCEWLNRWESLLDTIWDVIWKKKQVLNLFVKFLN